MHTEAEDIIHKTRVLDTHLSAARDELTNYKRLCRAQEKTLVLMGIFSNEENPTSLDAVRQIRSDILHMCDYIRASCTDSPIGAKTCSRALLAQEKLRERLARE